MSVSGLLNLYWKEVERVLEEEVEEEEEVTSMFPSSPHSSRQQAPHLVALDLQLLVRENADLHIMNIQLFSAGPDGQPVEFDGKRLRKTMMRKTVDYNSSFINMLHNRVGRYFGT